jgi:hypothetical protein
MDGWRKKKRMQDDVYSIRFVKTQSSSKTLWVNFLINMYHNFSKVSAFLHTFLRFGYLA